MNEEHFIYIPKFVKQVTDYNYGEVITHEAFNQLINLNTVQGDYNTEVLRLLLSEEDSTKTFHVAYLDKAITDLDNKLQEKINEFRKELREIETRIKDEVKQLIEDALPTYRIQFITSVFSGNKAIMTMLESDLNKGHYIVDCSIPIGGNNIDTYVFRIKLSASENGYIEQTITTECCEFYIFNPVFSETTFSKIYGIFYTDILMNSTPQYFICFKERYEGETKTHVAYRAIAGNSYLNKSPRPLYLNLISENQIIDYSDQSVEESKMIRVKEWSSLQESNITSLIASREYVNTLVSNVNSEMLDITEAIAKQVNTLKTNVNKDIKDINDKLDSYTEATAEDIAALFGGVN